MKAFPLFLALCGFALAITAVTAQNPPSDATLVTNPVYEKTCAKCHGKNAEGRHFRGPSLMSQKAADASADELRNIITNGKGHMPRFAGKLTTQEIETLVQEVKALNQK